MYTKIERHRPLVLVSVVQFQCLLGTCVCVMGMIIGLQESKQM